MSYGLQVFDSSGNLTLDISDTITRLAYSTQLAAFTNGNITITGLSSHTTTQFAVPLLDGLPHIVTKTGDVISWDYDNSASFPSVTSQLLVFFFGATTNPDR